MRTATREQTPADRRPASVAVLRWVFLRGLNALTCEIRSSGRAAFDVCVVPHWDVAAAIVERYDRPGTALRRHAEIAHSLRQSGWTVVLHGQADAAA